MSKPTQTQEPDSRQTIEKRLRNILAALERDGSLAPYTDVEVRALHNLVQSAEDKFGVPSAEKWASDECSQTLCTVLQFLRENGRIVPSAAVDAMGMFWIADAEYDIANG